MTNPKISNSELAEDLESALGNVSFATTTVIAARLRELDEAGKVKEMLDGLTERGYAVGLIPEIGRCYCDVSGEVRFRGFKYRCAAPTVVGAVSLAYDHARKLDPELKEVADE